MNIIDTFILSDAIELNLGVVPFTDRKILYDICHRKNLHTLSMYSPNNTISSYITEATVNTVEPVKELCISKIPFKITDPELETSIINELKFVTKIGIQYGPKTTIDSILSNSTPKNKLKIEHFLFQFSFLFSNNYVRLFIHRCDIVRKAKNELSQINIPMPKYFVPDIKSCAKFFIPNNNGKKFVRFDMINAVSSVIGIRDWEQFMRKFTSIELYATSKSFRGYIMKKIHIQCMQLVKEHLYNFIERLPLNIRYNYLYIGVDEIIMEFDADTNYVELMRVIDPDGYFRTEIFELEYVLTDINHWYVEVYDNGNQKIKAMCGNKKKLI